MHVLDVTLTFSPFLEGSRRVQHSEKEQFVIDEIKQEHVRESRNSNVAAARRRTRESFGVCQDFGNTFLHEVHESIAES